MNRFFGCDAHKRYSVFASVDEAGQRQAAVRVENNRALFRHYLSTLPPGSPIALETVGNWYWMVEEIEQAEHRPWLVHAAKAKLMMGQVNKTDKLDATALAVLLRNGTLPVVWIPPGELRDQRELARLRMALVQVRTRFKNRIHATLDKYALQILEVSDIFGTRGRILLEQRLAELPPFTRQCVETQLELLDQVQAHIESCEKRIQQVTQKNLAVELLRTLPGVGFILAVVMAMEIGDVNRFPTSAHLASYAGTVPRIKQSGGKTLRGKVRADVNRYLKWAFVEAANSAVVRQARGRSSHVLRLYQRIRQRQGHAKAVVAVSRHLAEAAFWVLKKNQPYQQPREENPLSSTRK